jgi:uncharacterized RDD family membrane protein YckC
MMICENCKQELSSSIGNCEACGHNPVLQRMDVWRERRLQKLALYQQAAEPQAQDLRAHVRGQRAEAKEATLIRFPKRPAAAPPEPPPPPAETVPVWKERLNSRLREIREQRAVEAPATPPPAPEKLDRNPIIINALNRIQRADYLQPITPLPRARTAVAAELAPLPVEETIPVSLPLPEVKPTHKKTIVTRIPTAPLTFKPAAMFEATPPPLDAPAVTAEDELLPEVQFDPIVPLVTSDPQDILETDSLPTTPTTLEAAALSKRFAAAVIDAEIIALSLLPLFGASFFLRGWFETPSLYLPVFTGLLLTTAYYFATYALAGRTMGMAWCNLHLASHSPHADTLANTAPSTVTFTLKQALLRSLGGTISLVLFPLNVLCIIRSDERLSLSDYLSQTQVVRIRK